MADDWSLRKLKQSYRPRYYGNRFQDVPDWKPGDNAVSFVNKYFNLATSNSDFHSIINRNSLSMQVTSHQSGEKTAQDASTSRVNDTPGLLKGVLWKTKDPPKKPSTTEINDNFEFSDESDNGDHDMIAKLIEESFRENNDILLGESEKCVEKLYSTDSSVLQERPSPTSKIHAKQCLSFRDVAAVARKNDNSDLALKKFSHNVEQLELQELEALNSNNENLNPRDATSDVRSKPTFVMEEERGVRSSGGWVSPFKKKTVSSFSTPVEAKQTPTPSKPMK